MGKPVYVLGTGLSHDGSSCLLKDGKVQFAIEKERLTRKKHDGGNDFLTVQYCLNAAGIQPDDLSLVVQVANFEKDYIKKDNYLGPRCFAGCNVPVITISHHLAHAYSAVGTSPFNECGVLIIDGCGSPLEQCDDLGGIHIPSDISPTRDMYCEKDSFYRFSGNNIIPLFKDFSKISSRATDDRLRLPTIEHSIGGVYNIASNYCFGNMDDAGKLMGLSPYGRYTGRPPIFNLANGRCFVEHTNLSDAFTMPATSYEGLMNNFQHYADTAWWVQQETTRAIQYLVQHRMATLAGPKKLALAGGVALNAVANSAILQNKLVEDLYIQPAAGDNGLSIGCAYYGWMNHLKHPKPGQQQSIFIGKSYSNDTVKDALEKYSRTTGVTPNVSIPDDVAKSAAQSIASGHIIGWYQGSAEFGPRALGHRSILADPRLKDIQLRINRDIKNREDFRPFAPSVLAEDAVDYFEFAFDSPYMIITDKIRQQWKDILKGVVHVDNSCRVQTVSHTWNPLYYDLIQSFKEITGISVVLNTSFNVRGMPIVETPFEAITLFYQTQLDHLFINNYKIMKE